MRHVRSRPYGRLIAPLLFLVSPSAHLAAGTDHPLLTSTTDGRYTTSANHIGTTPPRQSASPFGWTSSQPGDPQHAMREATSFSARRFSC